MLRRSFLLGASLCGSLFCVSASHADPVVFFDDVAGGRASFDSQISGANGTLYLDALSGLANGANSWTRSDFTITSSNGNNRGVHTTYLAGGAPATYTGGGEAIQMTADGSTTSGLTFTFTTPINGFGLDLGDWATCCFPSALYIAFDGGTPVQVGSAAVNTDNPGVGAGDGARTFVAAIDDSGTFSVITFYGTGAGDVLYAGGIIRYAVVPIGSLSGNYVTTASPTPLSGLAGYLDQHDDSGDLATVAGYLNTASESEVSQSLMEIFPVNTSITSQSMMGTMGQTTSVLVDKVGTVLGTFDAPRSAGFAGGEADDVSSWVFGGGAGTVSFADGSAGPDEGDMIAALSAMPYRKFQMKDHALWVEGVGGLSRGKSTADSFGYHTANAGFVAGYEYAVNERNLVGVLGSAFHSDIDLDSDAGETTVRSWTAGLYGQHLMDATKFSLVGLFGYGQYDGERYVDVGGITGRPQADYNSTSTSLTASVSRLYAHQGAEIEPFALINYTSVHSQGYTETGGGVYNMTVSADTFSTTSVKAGVTFSHKTTLKDKPLDLRFKPYAGYQWELADAGNSVRLSGAAGAGSVIDGRDINGAEGGVALEAKLQLTEDSTAKLGVDLSKDKNEGRAVAYVGYGMKF